MCPKTKMNFPRHDFQKLSYYIDIHIDRHAYAHTDRCHRNYYHAKYMGIYFEMTLNDDTFVHSIRKTKVYFICPIASYSIAWDRL